MISDNDNNLLLSLRNGSQQSFGQIFNMYHKRIYNFCLRMIHSPDDAEEIVQKVFVALWEQHSQLDPLKPLGSYLFSIARHMVYQEFRNEVYRKAAFAEIAEKEAGFNETTKDEVLFKELSDILFQIIDRLPARQKEIFRLSRDSGLSYKEIAERLGITENTVDTQLRRAREFLQKEYKRFYGNN